MFQNIFPIFGVFKALDADYSFTSQVKKIKSRFWKDKKFRTQYIKLQNALTIGLISKKTFLSKLKEFSK